MCNPRDKHPNSSTQATVRADGIHGHDSKRARANAMNTTVAVTCWWVVVEIRIQANAASWPKRSLERAKAWVGTTDSQHSHSEPDLDMERRM